MANRASSEFDDEFPGLEEDGAFRQKPFGPLLKWQALEAQWDEIRLEGDRPPGGRRDHLGPSSHHPMAAFRPRGVRGANQRQTRWTLRLSCQ
jgi:hypothetical protein